MIKRSINIMELLKKKQSFFLFGARGTGKTSLIIEALKNCPRHIEYDLLKIRVFKRLLDSPGLLRDEIETELKQIKDDEALVVFIDEVQKMPNLLDEVHSLIEEFKSRLFFILTGSSARKLKKAGINLLAGRAWFRYLHPLTFQEAPLILRKVLTTGSLPGVYHSEDPEEMLRVYVETYLKEEIIQEALVRRIENFSRFLDLAGQLNGEPINFTKLARQCSVSVKTAQEYFQILEDTLIAKRLYGWSTSVKKQLLQEPKFYFFDCGVLNAINGELKTELKPHTYRFGRLFETVVMNEAFRLISYHNPDLKTFYWRTSKGKEVDLLITKNIVSPSFAIEIKSSEQPDESDIEGLLAFLQDYPKVPAFCLCQTPRAYKIGPVKIVHWQDGLREILSLP